MSHGNLAGDANPMSAENGNDSASVEVGSAKPAGGGGGLLKVDSATMLDRARKLIKRWTKQKTEW